MKPKPTLTRKWSWTKRGWRYYNPELNQEFNCKEDFWFYLGRESWRSMKPPSKVDGYFLGDILQDWVRSHGTGKPCVILYDINVELKRPAFWLKIPKDRIKELTKEVVVLNCDSNQEMMDITISIDPLFATALGFSEDGQLIFSNQERTI